MLVPWVLAAMDTRVNGDTFRATCLVHDDPPEPSCVCGMYGTASLLDALFYVDRLITIPSFSRRVPEFIVPVVARAEFRRVLHMHYPVPGYGGAGIREIRATLVRIERLYVLPPAERPRRPYVELAARLGATYGVETSAEYPRYTRGDFDIHTAWTQHRQPHAQPIFVGTVTKPAAGQSISARRLGVVPAW